MIKTWITWGAQIQVSSFKPELFSNLILKTAIYSLFPRWLWFIVIGMCFSSTFFLKLKYKQQQHCHPCHSSIHRHVHISWWTVTVLLPSVLFIALQQYTQFLHARQQIYLPHFLCIVGKGTEEEAVMFVVDGWWWANEMKLSQNNGMNELIPRRRTSWSFVVLVLGRTGWLEKEFHLLILFFLADSVVVVVGWWEMEMVEQVSQTTDDNDNIRMVGVRGRGVE